MPFALNEFKDRLSNTPTLQLTLLGKATVSLSFQSYSSSSGLDEIAFGGNLIMF